VLLLLLLLVLLQGKVVDFNSLNSVRLPVFQHVCQCGLSACCVVKLAADLDHWSHVGYTGRLGLRAVTVS